MALQNRVRILACNYEFPGGFVRWNVWMIYRPVDATAKGGGKLADIGFDKAAAGADGQRI